MGMLIKCFSMRKVTPIADTLWMLHCPDLQTKSLSQQATDNAGLG